MGDRRGRRAVGGEGDIDAAGREESRGERSSSRFGGGIWGAVGCGMVVVWRAVVGRPITCKSRGVSFEARDRSWTDRKVLKLGKKT